MSLVSVLIIFSKAGIVKDSKLCNSRVLQHADCKKITVFGEAPPPNFEKSYCKLN